MKSGLGGAMEGSIADSTALRMRAQLQRMHHSSPTNGPDGFLEELLKIPAAPVADPEDQPDAEATSLDSLPTPASAQPDDKPQSSADDPEDKNEPTDDAYCAFVLQVCYAPQPNIEPSQEQPSADDAPPVLNNEVVATPVQSTVSDQEQVASAIVDDVAPVGADVGAEQPTAEVDESEVVQPVDANVAAQVKDTPVKNARDVRRSGENRKEPAAPSHQPQQVVKDSAATSEPHATQLDAHLQQTTEQHGPDNAQPVADAAPNQEQAATEVKRDSSDDRSQRDKWYEKSTISERPSGLVDRLQESAAVDRQDDTATTAVLEQSSAASAADSSATLVDNSALLVDAAPANSDNLQAMSDMAAAAQASAVQNARSQTVGESSSASGADLSGRGRQGSGAVAAPGTTGSGQASGAIAGRAGDTQTASTSSTNEAADGSHEITQQERVRLVQRVARSFSRLGPEGGQVSLKLHPPQLGVLNVSIKIEGQAMTARLQTETGAARDAIVENLSVLRDRLKEQGIEIEKFQVEVGQQEDMASGAGQSGTYFSGGNNSQQGDSPASTDYDLRRAARGSASRPASLAPPGLEPKLQSWPATDRTLDVRA